MPYVSCWCNKHFFNKQFEVFLHQKHELHLKHNVEDQTLLNLSAYLFPLLDFLHMYKISLADKHFVVNIIWIESNVCVSHTWEPHPLTLSLTCCWLGCLVNDASLELDNSSKKEKSDSRKSKTKLTLLGHLWTCVKYFIHLPWDYGTL